MKKIYIPPKTEIILLEEELAPIAASPKAEGSDGGNGDGQGGNGTIGSDERPIPPVIPAKSVSSRTSIFFSDDDYSTDMDDY